MNSTLLKGYFERLASLENEKKSLQEFIKEAYKEAKDEGFDILVMKEALRLAKMNPTQRANYDQLLTIYENALGKDIVVD